nr:MAG TPA: hypothetical protein [Caudoviricetes sp.]
MKNAEKPVEPVYLPRINNSHYPFLCKIMLCLKALYESLSPLSLKNLSVLFA